MKTKIVAVLSLLALAACSGENKADSDKDRVVESSAPLSDDHTVTTAVEPTEPLPVDLNLDDASDAKVKMRLRVQGEAEERFASKSELACVRFRDANNGKSGLRLNLGGREDGRLMFLELSNVEAGQVAFELNGGLDGRAPGKLSKLIFMNKKGDSFKNVSKAVGNGARDSRCDFKFDWTFPSGKLAGQFTCKDIAKIMRQGRDTKFVDQVKISGSFECAHVATFDNTDPQ